MRGTAAEEAAKAAIAPRRAAAAGRHAEGSQEEGWPHCELESR